MHSLKFHDKNLLSPLVHMRLEHLTNYCAVKLNVNLEKLYINMSIQERTPADSYGTVEQPHLEQPSRRCCKIKYRVRYFYSKGAFLVLLWTTLISVTLVQFNDDLVSSFSEVGFIQDDNHTYNGYWYLLVVLVFASIPIAGWLADTKLGNYQTFKTGTILIFLAGIVRSIKMITMLYIVIVLPINDYFSTESIFVAVRIMSSLVGLIGIAVCFVTALQLGLDQMPDASADNITSFIAWCIFSTFAGLWMSDTLLATLYSSASQTKHIWIVSCLLPSVCMAIVCCSMFLLAPRYLIVEPKSPQSLKTIYQVLKFAAKHKSPINRSAFTYWEENIPSRLDLGKSKYGGPFTTEQVEDVKTFFKILLTLVPILIILIGASFISAPGQLFANDCSPQLLYIYVFDSWWAIATFAYEFGAYPFIKNYLPSTLKRIGIAGFLLFFFKCLPLVVSALTYTNALSNSSASMYFFTTNHCYWSSIHSFLSGSVAILLFNGLLEFVCAQSPYNMRGLLTGCTMFLIFSSTSLNSILNILLADLVSNSLYSIAYDSTLLALSLVGFILHCVLAHWYKRRVRDEDYPVHRVVEEVYDRYLSHVTVP